MIECYQLILNTSDSGVPKSEFLTDTDDNDYDEVAEKVMDHINERLGRGMSVGGVRIA